MLRNTISRNFSISKWHIALKVFAAIALGSLNSTGADAPPVHDLTVKVEIEQKGISLSDGLPAALNVTNVGKTALQCDLWDLNSGVVLKIREVDGKFAEEERTVGFPSRRYIPTLIRSGETVKKEFSLLKLMPNLTIGSHRLRYLAVINVHPANEQGEGTGDMHGERTEGEFTVIVKP